MPANQIARDPLAAKTAKVVQEWFDLLSVHAPVERLLPFVSDTGLEMVFPERTLHSHADFLDWYDMVGKAYTSQTHTVEELSIHDNGDAVDVAVTVVWTARQTSDGAQLAFRVNQEWQLEKVADDPGLRIVKYHVGEMSAV